MQTTVAKEQLQMKPKRNVFRRAALYTSKALQVGWVVAEGYGIIFKHKLYKNPNDAKNTKYVQYVCRRLANLFNVHVHVHGEMPTHTALWVSNHISWLDIPVLGSAARVFFLSKAEVASWPIAGKLAKWGGTLFIQRGSGDSARIREQITGFLKQDIPVLFFPEATTGTGEKMRKVHGRLLAAAIDAQQPVQMLILCYTNQTQQLDQTIPYVGKQTLLENLTNVLQMKGITAHIKALPLIDTTGHTINSLTELVQEQMTLGMAQLHHTVLKQDV